MAREGRVRSPPRAAAPLLGQFAAASQRYPSKSAQPVQISWPPARASCSKTSVLRFATTSQSTHLHFTLYRCTEFVTYTASSVFTMGYAYSTLLAPLAVSDSRVPKPWRKADRNRSGVRAQYPETPDARRRTQSVAITIPGRKWTSLAEAVPPSGVRARECPSGPLCCCPRTHESELHFSSNLRFNPTYESRVFDLQGICGSRPSSPACLEDMTHPGAFGAQEWGNAS
jgi:hypothetical protein